MKLLKKNLPLCSNRWFSAGRIIVGVTIILNFFSCGGRKNDSTTSLYNGPDPRLKAKIFVSEQYKAPAEVVQSEETWLYVEMAKREFDLGNLGEALVYANKAHDVTRDEYASVAEKFSKLIKDQPYSSAGNSISELYNVLYERGEVELCRDLDEIFKQKSLKELSNSLPEMFAFLKARGEAVPESDLLIGRIFYAQGEFSQAKFYFERAWQYKDFFTVPDEKISLLYAMAENAEALQDYANEELYLLAVLAEDGLYGEKNKPSSKYKAMLKSVTSEKDLEKFFLLYRHNERNRLKAYEKLTQLAILNEDYEKALETACGAACIITTQLEEYVKKAHFTYEYTGIESLLTEASKDDSLCEWAKTQGFWESYMQFADVLYELGYISQAEDMYASIASAVPDYYIAQRAFYAIQRVRSYYVEKSATEDPSVVAEAMNAASDGTSSTLGSSADSSAPLPSEATGSAPEGDNAAAGSSSASSGTAVGSSSDSASSQVGSSQAGNSASSQVGSTPKP